MKTIMKMRIAQLLLPLIALMICAGAEAQKASVQSFYQITVYHFKDTAQESVIDQYLKAALLPALHRMNIKEVGVFKALSNDTVADKTMYVLMPVKSLEDVADIASKLAADAAYQTAGTKYLHAAYDTAPYARMETILLHAFPMAPQMQLPALKADRTNRVYELRSYESATENLNVSKVKMFNTGNEVGIFKRLDFNAVFYAEVIAGSHMPNLMYMTTFNNMQEREAHWKLFMNDSAFKNLLATPEYQHNVSKADIIFLRPAEYSDF